MIKSSHDIYAKNRQFFRKYHPEIFAKLSPSYPDIDITIQHMNDTIYNGDSDTFCRAQFQPEANNWVRLSRNFNEQDKELIDYRFASTHHHYVELLFNYYHNDCIEFDAHDTVKHCGLAASFGLGLGAHIDTLLQKAQCHGLVIIEPNIQYIACAAHLYDIETWQQKCALKGGQLHFCIVDTPYLISHYIRQLVTEHYFGYYDGSVLFAHLYAPIYMDAIAKTFNILPYADSNGGFTEDEIIMNAYTIINTRHHDYTIWYQQKTQNLHIPVFIVGSAPSLDTNIDYIKQYQHKAIIIGCGSGTHVLLRHQIIPDFHVEFENQDLTAQSFLHAVKGLDISSMRLISPFTVSPKIIDSFTQKYHYYRDSLSPNILLGQQYIVSNTNPNVTNLGIRFALLMGFKNIFLFGMDMSNNSEGLTHSSASNYIDKEGSKVFDEFYKNTTEAVANHVSQELSRRDVANLGGFVHLRVELSVSFMFLNTIIENARTDRLNVKFYNCSHGVYIPHTMPLLAEEIGDVLPKQLENKQDILQTIARDGQHDDLTDDMMRKHFIALHQKAKEYGDIIQTHIKDYQDGRIELDHMIQTIQAYHKKLCASNDNAGDNVSAAVAHFYQGTVEYVLNITLKYARRIEASQLTFAKEALSQNICYIVSLGQEALQVMITTPAQDLTLRKVTLARRIKYHKKRRRLH